MNTWNAGQILTVARTINKMDMSYLGPDEGSQDQTLIQFMNIALWDMARLCYNTEASDVMNVTADGVVDFTRGNIPITNMFEPLRLLNIGGGNEMEVPKRYSDTAPTGWYCESPNQPIDLKGIRGQVKLKYIRYPRQVTQIGDPVDCPESGYDALINKISAQVKSVKNFYEESAAMEAKAKDGYPNVAQAAISARGQSSAGAPPSFGDVTTVRGN